MYGKRYSGNESLNGRSPSHNSGFYGRVQNFNNDRSGFTFWSWNSVGDYDFSVREFNFRCFLKERFNQFTGFLLGYPGHPHDFEVCFSGVLLV